MKILIFIESLHSGGKERRLLELLTYLKNTTSYDLRLVIADSEIHYNYVHNLNIPIDVINRKYIKKDPSLFFRFFKIAKHFKPDIIHTWGTMSTIYAIPAKVILNKPMIANLIANAKKDYSSFSLTALFDKINYIFADAIIGNSMAGLKAYGLTNNPKTQLIYNGVHLERFRIKSNKEDLREKLKISTRYIAIMVASTSKSKDYDLFIDVAKNMSSIHNDITFIGVGDGSEFKRLELRIINENIKNIILTGRRNDIESLIACSDIALLFSQCEGLSNAIIEYMALGKPVITTDLIGGSREIIENEKSGYVMAPNSLLIASKIYELINNPQKLITMGIKGKQIIKDKFTIENMGLEYLKLYEKTCLN